jgi:hypothetical protein
MKHLVIYTSVAMQYHANLVIYTSVAMQYHANLRMKLLRKNYPYLNLKHCKVECKRQNINGKYVQSYSRMHRDICIVRKIARQYSIRLLAAIRGQY